MDQTCPAGLDDGLSKIRESSVTRLVTPMRMLDVFPLSPSPLEPPVSPIEFGAQIRARRQEQHLEIAELAKLIGVTRQHLADMEAGSFFDGDGSTIAAIDAELDHPPHDCLMFEGIDRWLPAEPAKLRLKDAEQRREVWNEFVDFVEFFLPRDQTCHRPSQC